GGADALAARHAEGHDLRVLEREFAGFLEVLEVLRVGQRVTALDVVHAQFVEPAREEQFVLQGEVDAFALAAVAEGGVVDLNARHGGTCNKKALKPRASGPGQSHKMRGE